jgi:hypothetical protein
VSAISARVLVFRRRHHPADRPVLHDPALVQHRDALGDVGHQRDVVGDEQQRHPRVLEAA